MYHYSNSGKVYGDMPPPIGEHAIVRHVGGNANGIKPYPKDAGMISMSSNLRGLQAASVSIGETNVECQIYEWRENTYQTLRKTFGDARVEFSTSKVKFEGRYKPGGAATTALGAWTHCVVDTGSDATVCERWSYITYGGKAGKRLMYITVYRVCDQTYPGDTTAWKQQYNIQSKYESARIGNIDPQKQTLVDLEYFVNDLRHKEHDVAIFIDTNQNYRRCYRPQVHDNHFESDGGLNIEGSLKTFLENTCLNNKHGTENVPSTREPGSKVSDYVLVCEGLLPSITSIGMISQDVVFARDHRSFFMGVDAALYFGHEMDVMPAKQLRQLQLDDPRIADEYIQQFHGFLTGHNVYRRVKTIMERSKTGNWSLEDEGGYEKIDRDITWSMLCAAKKCVNRSKKCTPWSPALCMATQSIGYWDVRINREGERNPLDLVLNFYLSKSDVDKDDHDKPMPIQECIKQLNFSRQKLKNVVSNAKEHSGQYAVEIAEATVEKRNPRFKDGEIFDPVGKDIVVEREVKTREKRQMAQRAEKSGYISSQILSNGVISCTSKCRMRTGQPEKKSKIRQRWKAISLTGMWSSSAMQGQHHSDIMHSVKISATQVTVTWLRTY
jgi:hypothetical protein